MKTPAFYDLDYAVMYLNNTIIRLSDKPIYIQEIKHGTKKNSEFILRYSELGKMHRKKDYKTVNLAHPKLNMDPVKLGWLAVDKKSKKPCVYLSRIPNRTWHIGLCNSNYTYCYDQKERELTGLNSLRGISFFLSRELKNTIMGVYPSFKEAYDFSKEDGKMYAFSRRFAVYQDKLFYKYIKEPVGEVVDGQPILTSGSFYLNEVLKEDLNA